MKRYYISDIINDPDLGWCVPSMLLAGTRTKAEIPVGPDGQPTSTWALCHVAAKDHAVLRSDKRIDPLPDFPMDGKVSAVNEQTRSAMKAALNRRGLPAAAIVDGKDGYREVIRAVGRALNPAFSEDSFDVADVT